MHMTKYEDLKDWCGKLHAVRLAVQGAAEAARVNLFVPESMDWLEAEAQNTDPDVAFAVQVGQHVAEALGIGLRRRMVWQERTQTRWRAVPEGGREGGVWEGIAGLVADGWYATITREDWEGVRPIRVVGHLDRESAIEHAERLFGARKVEALSELDKAAAPAASQ